MANLHSRVLMNCVLNMKCLFITLLAGGFVQFKLKYFLFTQKPVAQKQWISLLIDAVLASEKNPHRNAWHTFSCRRFAISAARAKPCYTFREKWFNLFALAHSSMQWWKKIIVSHITAHNTSWKRHRCHPIRWQRVACACIHKLCDGKLLMVDRMKFIL